MTITRTAATTGRRRMREIAAKNERKRQEIAARILADLGRPPLMIDVIAAQNLAALHVKADQIEAAGRNASAIRQQITQAMRAGFRPDKPAPAPKTDFRAEMLRLATPEDA